MPIDSAISTLLQNGLLGAIIVILGAVVVYQYKQLNNEKLERLKDWQNGNMSNVQALTEIRISIQRMLDLLTQAKRDV